MAIPVDAGRPGDIWRLHANDRPVLVRKRNERMIVFQPVAEPDGPTYAMESDDWDSTLERFREDLEILTAGDRAHIFVPKTEVYILRIAKNKYKASGKGWVAWKSGKPPTPDIEDSGLFFDPSSDWNLDGDLLYRPFRMLEDGEQVVDSKEQHWSFMAPFWFTDEDGQRGSPAWPLVLAGDEGRTKELNNTSEDHEKKEWAERAGVEPEVFDLEWPTW